MKIRQVLGIWAAFGAVVLAFQNCSRTRGTLEAMRLQVEAANLLDRVFNLVHLQDPWTCTELCPTVQPAPILPMLTHTLTLKNDQSFLLKSECGEISGSFALSDETDLHDQHSDRLFVRFAIQQSTATPCVDNALFGRLENVIAQTQEIFLEEKNANGSLSFYLMTRRPDGTAGESLLFQESSHAPSVAQSMSNFF